MLTEPVDCVPRIRAAAEATLHQGVTPENAVLGGDGVLLADAVGHAFVSVRGMTVI